MRIHSLLITAVAIAALGVAVPARADNSRGRVYTTVQRMQLKHLAAEHKDVQALHARRIKEKKLRYHVKDLGLQDFKSILHAHAEDSGHTGGSRPEMARDAKPANVKVIMLTDHFRPPRDFMDSWRGMHNGVLFIPGSEMYGYLLYPDHSVMDYMGGPDKELVKAVTAGTGLIFLSHVEERVNHSMDGLTGMEIYNRHADAFDDKESMLAIALAMTNPKGAAQMEEALKKYPDEMLAAQCDYMKLYMDKWDKESQHQKVVGIAACDCHHNQVFILKKVDDNTALLGTIVDDDDGMRKITTKEAPQLPGMLKGHKPGDIVVRLDFDPYYRMFMCDSTHIMAKKLTEPAIRAALHKGHAYVSHDWLCNPDGFLYYLLRDGKIAAIMGDDTKLQTGDTLGAQFPLSCIIRLYRNGKQIKESEASTLNYKLTEPGVYRVEGWVKVDDEQRPWIYSNPIYVR